MINKKILTKFILSAVVFGCLWFSATSAWSTFKIVASGIADLRVEQNLVPVHFADNGNDFGGFFHLKADLAEEDATNTGDMERTPVTLWGETYDCWMQVKWFYYNAERGNRLRPLDEETAENRGMLDELDSIEWWLYTNCRKQVWSGYTFDEMLDYCGLLEKEEWWGGTPPAYDRCESRESVDELYQTDHGYYGMIDHTYQSREFSLIAGVDYYTWSTWIEMYRYSGLSPSFIRWSNKIPVWFVYDTKWWWVGFAGCEVLWDNTRSTLNKVLWKFKEKWSLAWMFEITGAKQDKLTVNPDWWLARSDLNCDNIWAVGDSMLGLIVEWIVWMSNDKRTQIWNQNDDKMQLFSSVNVNNATLINYTKQKAEQLCRWKWSNRDPWNSTKPWEILCVSWVDIANGNRFIWRTLIVKNGNVSLESVPAWSLNDNKYFFDMFIDNGDLIVQETSDMAVFNNMWFVSTLDIGLFNNSVVGALLSNSDYMWTDVAVASLLRGNFIVNWQIKASGNNGILNNKYFIHGKFTSKDTYDTLMETFSWRCKDWQWNNDGNYCPYSCKASGCPQHFYTRAPLVVVDQTYNSPLYW